MVVNTIRLAGVSIDESVRYNTRIEEGLLGEFPDEIEYIWSRIGTAEVATDPMGIELTDIFMTLKPRTKWTRADTQSALVVEMEKTISQFPGVNMVFTQPIEMRMNEMVSGIRSDIGIKIFGDDFDEAQFRSTNPQVVRRQGDIDSINTRFKATLKFSKSVT